MGKFKEIAASSFYQLLTVYGVFVLLVALGIFYKFSLQFHLFAIVLALIGISILPEKMEELKSNKVVHYLILIGALVLVVVFRTIPYLDNSLPLGYDVGIYKYGIEKGLENRDLWILSGGMEPGFLYLMSLFKAFLSTETILTWLFIGFCALLGFAVYLFAKEFAGKEAALFSVVVYALSIVQFKTFWYLYYKNVIGLSVMLFSLYFLRRYEKFGKKIFLAGFVLLGGILLAIHRPTFYIFGLSYFIYAFVSPWKNCYDAKRMRTNILAGVLILALGFLFYLGDFLPAITQILPFVAQGFVAPGESPGTFITFFSYQFSTLFYLPTALLGLFYFVKKKQFNYMVIWAIINLAIVYFQFFFFNRFIIHLDIALIILSGVGFSILRQKRNELIYLIIGFLFISGMIISYNESSRAKPLISEDTLNLIKTIPSFSEKDAKIISISSEYSPWVLGYSDRTTIAPGLFDENKWNLGEWQRFWNSSDENETREMVSVYGKQIYLFAGTKSFNNSCFSVYSETSGGKIYKYGC